jgi:hypothetical protein
MNRSYTLEPKLVASEIPGYVYGSQNGAKSPINEKEFELLKQSAGFTREDEHWLRMAGAILADQANALVARRRAVIAAHPHLARCLSYGGAQNLQQLRQSFWSDPQRYLIKLLPSSKVESFQR